MDDKKSGRPVTARRRAGPGRNPKTPREKYVQQPLKIPGWIKDWLIDYKERTGKAKNAFIVEAVEEKIQRNDSTQITFTEK